jgi:Na+/phosphate symporter
VPNWTSAQNFGALIGLFIGIFIFFCFEKEIPNILGFAILETIIILVCMWVGKTIVPFLGGKRLEAFLSQTEPPHSLVIIGKTLKWIFNFALICGVVYLTIHPETALGDSELFAGLILGWFFIIYIIITDFLPALKHFYYNWRTKGKRRT